MPNMIEKNLKRDEIEKQILQFHELFQNKQTVMKRIRNKFEWKINWRHALKKYRAWHRNRGVEIKEDKKKEKSMSIPN